MNNQRLLTKSDIAEIFGVSRPVVIARIRQNDIKPDGKSSGVDGYRISTILPHFQVELGSVDTTMLEAKERKILAEAKLAEQELALKKGLVTPVAEVDAEVAEMVAQVRTAFINLPKKVAPSLLAVDELVDIIEILEAEVYDALTRLADGDFDRVQHSDSGEIEEMV